jgi:hypothetical protein
VVNALHAVVHLRNDNGSKLVSKAVKAWCAERGARTLYIDPESPRRHLPSGSLRTADDENSD